MRVRIAGGAGCSGALAGAIAGFLIVAVPALPEFLDRCFWAASGGRGERASWGEPLFYLLAIGIPAALAGATAGALIGRGISAIRARACGK